MWTPKRVLLLLAGFGLFLFTYFAYAAFLGGIDGLPPLPEEYWPEAGNPTEPPPPPPIAPVDLKLQMAFGEGWETTLKSPVRLEMKSKNLVLATRDFFIQDDGKVRLTPFNIAIFGKDKGDGKLPEINTVQSEVAYLTFDRPVTNLYDLGRHKIVAGELQRNIRIRNNRHTAAGSDDLSLSTDGPMFYWEDRHLIATPAPVQMLDEQSTPEPTRITAVGMDLHLSTESDAKPPAGGAPRKAKVQSISGVESIHLLATVEMHLWVDGNSGFLGGGPAAGTPDKPQEKPQLVITTAGPFHYYVSQDNDAAPDRATFDVPAQPSRLPEQVIVTRLIGPRDQEKRDQLFCEHLELTFRRKAEAAPQKGAGPKDGGSVEQLAVQDAHATSRPGQLVELKSDAEVLHAMGSDFFYDARTKESVLKGDPEMVALKDGHEIHARELRMENAGQKDIQKAKARGPGRIAMLDAKSGKRTMHARWKDELDFNKEGANDCLTLTGGAAFADAEQGWQLRADRLKLWLQPAAQALAGAVPQRNKPHHLEATGHVTGGSPDLHIKEPTEHLMIWFKDAPAGAAPPARAAADRGAPAEKSPQPLPSGGRQPPEPASAQGANAPRSGGLGTSVLGTLPGSPRPQGQAAADPNAKKPPMELSARTVDAYVLRTGERNDLERLWCQGDVHVHQEPAAPDDRGVDILGETLQLDHAPDGSVMVVTGHLGQVQMNKICILGPEILIDQKRNTAKVNGVGAMQMLTKSSLEGEPLAEPTELTVNWDKEMFFNGQYAVFQGGPGGIQAEQVNSRLRCKEMQVFLDRPVSFKEGDKGGQPAKVKNLVCDKKVVIEDTTREGPELRRYTRLTSPSVALDNESGEVRASGPGVVHILQLEAEDEGPLGNPAPARPPAGWPNGPTKKDVPPDEPAKKDPPADDPAKKEAAKRLVLTRVQYLASMYANNRARTAIFRGDVDTVHVPTDNPDLVVDLDRLPPGGMHMHCELLRVFNRRRADGTMTQEMEAVGKVYINAQEFWGQAHTVKFDEAKDLIILEGKDGGKASLYQVKGQGGKPSEMIARKIYFWRKTNKVHFEGGQVISVNQ